MGKEGVKFILVMVMAMAVAVLGGQTAFAATTIINIDGGNGTVEVDDHGGYEGYNELIWGLDHTSSLFLAAYDSISGELDNPYIDDYMGNGADDREDTWGNSPSGVATYSAPVAGMPACVGDVAADDSGVTTPISFVGGNTGLTVQQFVYGGANAPFAIYQYTITNNTGVTKDVKIAHFGDFDVGSTNPNEEEGYDAANQLVWIWESSSGGYMQGTALLQMTVSNYFVEDCCTLSYGTYNAQVGFFTGDPTYNGDKFAGPDDMEVDIATDIGTLTPGASATVVFVSAASSGGTSAAALADMQATIAEASLCYDQIALLQATSVPTANEWGLIVFMVLAGLTAAYFLPGRRSES